MIGSELVAGSQESLERTLIIPDTHAPAHDVLAWNVMLMVARAFKPDRVVLLGDFINADPLKTHPPSKDPRHQPGFEDEVLITRGLLRQLEELGAKEYVYIMGNHEFRLDRYLATRAPEIMSVVPLLPALLHLEKWKIIPYRRCYKLGKVKLTHDTGQAGATAHRAAGSTVGGSVIIGHTHRMAMEVEGRLDDTPVLHMMLGWLGNVSEVDYIHEASSAKWVHGFGLGYTAEDGVTFVQPVPIVNYKCVYNGRLYRPLF